MLRHKDTNIILTGGVDDIWQHKITKQLIVVDYKSQAKLGRVDKQDYLDDPYHEGYKIQMDFYAYLLKGMGFDVHKKSYFLVCNAKRKSCCVSRSFGKKVESLEKLKESITTHCLNAAEKIRTDKQTTRAVTVFIRTSPFDKNRKYYSNSITIELPVDTNNSLELVKTAINGLNKIYKYGYFYQKAGIILSKLKNSSEKELNLLAPILENKSKTLMKAIDFTNAKYGRNAISIAQAGINNDWKMRREHSSKIDTASFDSLPKISI